MNPRTLTMRTDEIEEAAFCQDRIQPFMQDLSHHRNTREIRAGFWALSAKAMRG